MVEFLFNAWMLRHTSVCTWLVVIFLSKKYGDSDIIEAIDVLSAHFCN